MHRFVLYVGLIFIMGCGPAVQKDDLNQLNGYWEIEEVEFENGQTKEYTISTTIDYIEMDGMSGFRKKVQPQLSGSYQTSDDAEPFEIFEKEGTFLFAYGQGTQQWEEVLLSLDENTFSVRNVDNKIYRYKRYEPLNLQP
jgi:hypothetical protein